ncbi:glycosyltransferase [Candidatus Dependentiae bacterium]|nr:glycosyltransferase [Candidatus Dependentiae bacterium]
MSIINTILSVYFIVGFLMWLVFFFSVLKIIKEVPVIDEFTDPELSNWPMLSLIIPACNEETTIEASVRKRLKEDYPNLELIIINDRSTDCTGEIIDRIALEDKRIKALTITELPKGWLGKVHAQQKGLEQAKGEYLLFSDADVHYEPGTLKKIIAYCEANFVDHLSAIPELWAPNFIVEVIYTIFGRLFLAGLQAWKVNNPKSRAYIGVGAFNLVRRESFERTEGFEYLKMDIADDVALGKLMKRAGMNSKFVNGRKRIGLLFHPSIKNLIVSSERATFSTMGNFSAVILSLKNIFWTLMELSPFLMFIPFRIPYLNYLGFATVFLAILTSSMLNRWTNRPILPAFFIPLGIPFITYANFRAAWLGWKRKGIIWRGTYYSSKELKKGKRVSL